MAVVGGVCDLLDVYARPLPGAVLCELLGVPAGDRGWISATVTAHDEPGEADRVTEALGVYLDELIAAKRRIDMARALDQPWREALTPITRLGGRLGPHRA
jgi:cytochrome P450